MNRIIAVFATLAFTTLSVLGAASSASATDKPSADNKKVTLCHYKGDNGAPNGYQPRIEVSVNGWYSGHRDHSRDIWDEFTYTTKDGSTVTVPAQGDTSLLAFEDCQQPPEDEVIAVEPIVVEKCGTKNDSFTVPESVKYTSSLSKDGLNWTLTVTAADGFKFANGKTVTFTHTFTAEDCDLPETGAEAVYNTPAGIAALGGILLLGGVTFVATRRRKA